MNQKRMTAKTMITTIPAARTTETIVSEQRMLIGRLMREKQQLQSELERLSQFRLLAYRDDLTGLYNRRYLDERLQEECARAQRDSKYRFAILLFDVNDFKCINDTKGHHVGDQVLSTVANALATNVRKSDVCARLGGDEFVILLHQADPERCRRVLKRLRSSLLSLYRDHNVRLSVGMAVSTAKTVSSPATLLRLADQAMYRNKKTQKRDSDVRHMSASRRRTVSMPSTSPREGSFVALANTSDRRRAECVFMRPVNL